MEFMLPIEPRAVAAAGRAETVVSVAIAELQVPMTATSVVDRQSVGREDAGPRYNAALPLLLAIVLLLPYLAL